MALKKREFELPDQWVELSNVTYKYKEEPAQKLAPIYYNVTHHDIKFMKPEEMEYCVRHDVFKEQSTLPFYSSFIEDLGKTFELQAAAAAAARAAAAAGQWAAARDRWAAALDAGAHLRPEAWAGFALAALEAWAASPALKVEALPVVAAALQKASSFPSNRADFGLRVGLARALAHGGGLAEAARAADAVVELGPYSDQVEAAMLLAAECYARLGRPREELRYLEFLVGAGHPGLPPFALHLLASGRFREAGDQRRADLLLASAHELSGAAAAGAAAAAATPGAWLRSPRPWAALGAPLLRQGLAFYARSALAEAAQHLGPEADPAPVPAAVGQAEAPYRRMWLSGTNKTRLEAAGAGAAVLRDLARCQRLCLDPAAPATMARAYRRGGLYDPGIRGSLGAWHEGWAAFFKVQEYAAVRMQSAYRRKMAQRLRAFLAAEIAREQAREAEQGRKLMEFWYFQGQALLQRCFLAWRYRAEATRRERGKAATLLQALARRRQAKTVLEDKQKQAIELKKIYMVVVKLFARGTAARSLGAWRLFVVLCRQDRHATQIQCLARLILARRRVRALRYVRDKNHQRRMNAMLTVFNNWYFGIRREKYGEMAATDIQRMYRGMADRRRVRKIKRAILQLKRVFLGDEGTKFFMMYRLRWFVTLNQSAKKIQIIIRAFVLRKHAKRNKRLKNLFFRATAGPGRKCLRAWYDHMQEQRVRKDAAARCIQTLRHLVAARVMTAKLWAARRAKEDRLAALRRSALSRRLGWIVWGWWEVAGRAAAGRAMQRVARGFLARRYVGRRRARTEAARQALRALLGGDLNDFVTNKYFVEWKYLVHLNYHAVRLTGFFRIICSKNRYAKRVAQLKIQQESMARVLSREAHHFLMLYTKKWADMVIYINSARMIQQIIATYAIFRREVRLASLELVSTSIETGKIARAAAVCAAAAERIQCLARRARARGVAARARARAAEVRALLRRHREVRQRRARRRAFREWALMRRREASAVLILQCFLRTRRAHMITNALRRKHQATMDKIAIYQEKWQKRLLLKCLAALEGNVIEVFEVRFLNKTASSDAETTTPHKPRRPLSGDPPAAAAAGRALRWHGEDGGDAQRRPFGPAALAATARLAHTQEGLSAAYFAAVRAARATGTLRWDRRRLGLGECRAAAAAASTVICPTLGDDDLEALAEKGAADADAAPAVGGAPFLEEDDLYSGGQGGPPPGSRTGGGARRPWGPWGRGRGEEGEEGPRRALARVVACNGPRLSAVQGRPALCRLVQGCGSLTSLTLASVALGNAGAVALAEAWAGGGGGGGGGGAPLEELVLDGCGVGAVGAAAVFLAARGGGGGPGGGGGRPRRGPPLRRLGLPRNPGAGRAAAAPALAALLADPGAFAAAAAELDLAGCGVGDLTLRALAEGGGLDLRRCGGGGGRGGRLRRLRLDGNPGITDEGANVLAECLEHNVALEHINLNGCSITDKGCIALANCLLFNKRLESLWLCNNRVTGPGVWAMARATAQRAHLARYHGQATPASEEPSAAADLPLLRGGGGGGPFSSRRQLSAFLAERRPGERLSTLSSYRPASWLGSDRSSSAESLDAWLFTRKSPKVSHRVQPAEAAAAGEGEGEGGDEAALPSWSRRRRSPRRPPHARGAAKEQGAGGEADGPHAAAPPAGLPLEGQPPSLDLDSLDEAGAVPEEQLATQGAEGGAFAGAPALEVLLDGNPLDPEVVSEYAAATAVGLLRLGAPGGGGSSDAAWDEWEEEEDGREGSRLPGLVGGRSEGASVFSASAPGMEGENSSLWASKGFATYMARSDGSSLLPPETSLAKPTTSGPGMVPQRSGRSSNKIRGLSSVTTNLLPSTVVSDPRSELSRPFTAPAFNVDFTRSARLRNRAGPPGVRGLLHSKTEKQLPAAAAASMVLSPLMFEPPH